MKFLWSIVLLLSFNTLLAQFTGGLEDGYALDLDVNPTSIYSGGTEDGHHHSELMNLISIYRGDTMDGYAKSGFMSNFSIYIGGTEDGYAKGEYQNPISIYRGGSEDGYDKGHLILAVNSICNGAEVISEGVYLGNQINGGNGAVDDGCFGNGTDALWFEYTPTCDKTITISSSIDLDQPDTRLSVFTGNCSNLQCEAFDNDSGEGGTSVVSFSAMQGTTYYIEWDDKGGTEEFDFEISSNTTCPSDCPGDFNEDGIVTIADLTVLLSEFGCQFGCNADLNNDGQVTSGDLSIFLSVYGTNCQ